MTERILVQAAQSGRPEATDELIERYYPRVYSFVATLQGADAEDLTQEVFARALGALPRFNGEYQFGAWLLQIARNVCIDEARRQMRRPQPTDPVDLVELETPQTQPDHVWESVSSQIAVTTVHRALVKLPKRQRTVLVLRELEGMSYADIAIALLISTRAVEISLSRARKRLRLELKRLEAAEGERASCRRTLSLLAADPAALSSKEVLDHLRTCSICQADAERRGHRGFLHAGLAMLAAGSAHAADVLRRQAAWGERLLQTMLGAPGTPLSPLSRLAEIGASVAVATAVSAGTFSAATPVQPVTFPDPPASISVPADTAPAALPVVVARPAVHLSKRVAVPAPAAAQPSPVGILPCAVNALGRVASGPSGSSGQLLSELLDPMNALSPVLACDPTLSSVGTTLGGVGKGVQNLTSSLTQPQSQPTDPKQLLDNLLGGGQAKH
jgi:RNA polymerase sigma-70 factor (ECF subfamily)